MRQFLLTLLFVGFFLGLANAQNDFRNFKVAVYTRAQEVNRMKDTNWLESSWKQISANLHVDKIYLETHRDFQLVDEVTLNKAIVFFKSKGLEVAGGITFTVNESNNFETFCYSNPEQRKKAKEIIEFTARHFDQIILDDFFFTSCKCNLCIEAKGNQSWSEYRLKLMTEAAQNLIVGPAKAVNPNVKVIIKYPNWYDHFQECGFNLETEPQIFDGLYTGTETRDAVNSDQHLQPYLGYLVVRYFENLKPGHNGGGWVDTYGSRNYDRYAEQLWLTIFAKAPQITLFEYGAMASPLRPELVAPWKDQNTSFQYSSFLPIKEGQTMAKAVSQALTVADKVAGDLGVPYGIKSYKPFHSSGEDFLQNYFGMIGIPMNLVPEFPMDDQMIILTEQAKKDPGIVQKIEQRLRAGKDVMITSGLLNAIQDRGIRNIVNLEFTSRKALVDQYKVGFSMIKGKSPVMIPQIQYSTNDSWEEISGLSNGLGWPLLVRGKYGNANLYVLAVPDNFSELYTFPAEVLNRLREILCESLGIRFKGPSDVSMFLYDNNTVLFESFNDEPAEIEIVFNKENNFLLDLATGEKLEAKVIPARTFMGRVFAPETYNYSVTLPPHSFRAFKTAGISGSTGFRQNEPVNTLTQNEISDGWMLLFDGKTSQGLVKYDGNPFPAKGWVIENGLLTLKDGSEGGDIKTIDEYSDFELNVDFRYGKACNSGIKYFYTNYPKGGYLGMEYQILDDSLGEDRNRQDHLCGALYDIFPPDPGKKILKKPGEWNRATIISKGKHIEHWLNGEKILEFERGSREYLDGVAKSKYKSDPVFGMIEKGNIMLQDHGHEISFRNIKIRKLT